MKNLIILSISCGTVIWTRSLSLSLSSFCSKSSIVCSVCSPVRSFHVTYMKRSNISYRILLASINKRLIMIFFLFWLSWYFYCFLYCSRRSPKAGHICQSRRRWRCRGSFIYLFDNFFLVFFLVFWTLFVYKFILWQWTEAVQDWQFKTCRRRKMMPVLLKCWSLGRFYLFPLSLSL